MHGTKESENASTSQWNSIVSRAVTNLKFGVVQIVVHDGKVVQIETTEKVRFNQGE
jgi:hypothetical protein